MDPGKHVFTSSSHLDPVLLAFNFLYVAGIPAFPAAFSRSEDLAPTLCSSIVHWLDKDARIITNPSTSNPGLNTGLVRSKH